MSDFDRTAADAARPGAFAYDAHTAPELYEGVLSKRVVAFVIDAVIIVALMIPASLVIVVVGFVTLGLAWLLFPALFALVALGYSALTLGGARSATVGMRWSGLEMRTWNGAPMFPLLAVMHSLLFWFSVSFLTPLVLIVGLLTPRKQLLHDLVLGTVAVNAGGLRRMAL
ncbi:MAG: RDD family protein [Bauldia sp.]